MDYLKVYTSFAEIIEPLNESERGRLFTAMLEYAETGEAPELKGNERYVWPIAKQNIDRAREENERLKTNGSKGGRPKAEESNENQPKPTETKAKQTKAYKEKDNDNDKDKDNEKKVSAIADTKESARPAVKIPNGFERFWESYPRKTAKAEAIKAFEKLKPDAMLIETMVKAIQTQKQSAQWQEDGGRFIPHPATWLNQHRWEDEMPKAGKAPLKIVNAAKYDQREYNESDFEEADRALLAEAAAMM